MFVMALTPEATKTARFLLGLSQRALARRAGVSRSCLNQFERKRWAPSSDFLHKLSGFFTEQGVWPREVPLSSDKQALEQATPKFQLEKNEFETLRPSCNDTGRDHKSKWFVLRNIGFVVGILGVLAVTGNLSSAFSVIKKARQ